VTTRASTSTAFIGGAIGLYAIFDTLILGLPIVVLAVRFNSLAVFGVAAVAVFVLNVACCTWVDVNWGQFAAGPGRRVGDKIEKLRTRKALEKPVGWITSGSTRSYALAAAVINAILVVATARVVTGRPVGTPRIRTASLTYALLFCGVYSVCGYALGKVIDLL
jgi:hypothetical protein